MAGTVEEKVVLVDEQDNPLGVCEKLAAHENGGVLHRAFSIFVFNDQKELLLQRRASQKYHFGGLWTNSCCSHPRPGESASDAAHRRLVEEFGFDTMLTKQFEFIYRAEDAASGLTEHELDHVFFGQFNGTPIPNPDEISAWRWASLVTITAELQNIPEQFTPWFRIAFDRVRSVV
jgi:isopentenyl-diphosphate Delta-isomerase